MVEIKLLKNKIEQLKTKEEISHTEKTKKLEENLQNIANDLYGLIVDLEKTEDTFWKILKTNSKDK